MRVPFDVITFLDAGMAFRLGFPLGHLKTARDWRLVGFDVCSSRLPDVEADVEVSQNAGF